MVEEVARYATYVTSFACALAVVIQVKLAMQIIPRSLILDPIFYINYFMILDPGSNFLYKLFHNPFQTALLPSWRLYSPQADKYKV